MSAGLSGCSLLEREPGDGRVVLVDDCCADRERFFTFRYDSYVWRGNTVWGGSPLHQLSLGADLHGTSDTVFSVAQNLPPGSFANPEVDLRVQGKYVTADATGARLLIVRSNYTDVIGGRLTLFEPLTGRVRVLIDSTAFVSTAVFDPANPGRIVYYKYGMDPENDAGGEAGYYALDLQTGASTQLLRHFAPGGLNEGVNGFDLSPDGRTLLYADVRGDAAPRVVLRDLASGRADTLSPDLPGSALWLRYHPGGRHALYASFDAPPVHAQGYASPSEVGVLDLATGALRPLEVTYPEDAGAPSRVVMPVWSPDGRHVLVGRGAITRDGRIKAPSLYVIKDVM